MKKHPATPEEMETPLIIGSKTPWGKVAAMGMKDGERWYMMVKRGVVSLIPGPVAALSKLAEGRKR